MSRGALEYLSASDWNLVASKSKKYLSKRTQTLIREGSMPKTVYLLRSGKVRVERSTAAAAPSWSRSARSIFGEMAFIETRSPARRCARQC